LKGTEIRIIPRGPTDVHQDIIDARYMWAMSKSLEIHQLLVAASPRAASDKKETKTKEKNPD